MTRKRAHVFGFHPSSRGFGWVLIEEPYSLLDWGVVDIRTENVVALYRLEALLDRHRPTVLALERNEGAIAQHRQRMRKLYLAVVKCAKRKGIEVHSYSRPEILNATFAKGARTREEVAAAVAVCLAALRPRLPKPRQIWIGERSAMRLFSAAACALTYFDAHPR